MDHYRSLLELICRCCSRLDLTFLWMSVFKTDKGQNLTFYRLRKDLFLAQLFAGNALLEWWGRQRSRIRGKRPGSRGIPCRHDRNWLATSGRRPVVRTVERIRSAGDEDTRLEDGASLEDGWEDDQMLRAALEAKVQKRVKADSSQSEVKWKSG